MNALTGCDMVSSCVVKETFRMGILETIPKNNNCNQYIGK